MTDRFKSDKTQDENYGAYRIYSKRSTRTLYVRESFKTVAFSVCFNQKENNF